MAAAAILCCLPLLAIGPLGASMASADSAKPGSHSHARTSGLKLAESQLTAAKRVPKFVAPGPAFTAKKAMKGKTIFTVSIGTEDEFIHIIQTVEQQIAKKLGFNYVVWTNTGTPSQWQKGIATAISEHVSEISLLGINPEQVKPEIAQAVKAGIPVVVSDSYDMTQKPPASLKLKATVRIPYSAAGRLMADQVAVATKGKGSALVIGSPEVAASAAQVAAIKHQFAKVCPKCHVKYTGITIANWATQTGPLVEGAIRANPALDYILPVYDSESEYIIPAISTEGATGRVHIVSYDGTAFVLKDLEQGNAVTMDVGQDLAWLAYAFMDQNMRVLAGLKPLNSEKLPLRVFTSKNVSDAGKPPGNTTGYGKGYISGYLKLWKVKR